MHGCWSLALYSQNLGIIPCPLYNTMPTTILCFLAQRKQMIHFLQGYRTNHDDSLSPQSEQIHVPCSTDKPVNRVDLNYYSWKKQWLMSTSNNSGLTDGSTASPLTGKFSRGYFREDKTDTPPEQDITIAFHCAAEYHLKAMFNKYYLNYDVKSNERIDYASWNMKLVYCYFFRVRSLYLLYSICLTTPLAPPEVILGLFIQPNQSGLN